MREPTESRVPKWAFLLGDAILLGAAYFLFLESKQPMGAWPMGFVVVCVLGGAWLAIMPFLLDYRLQLKLAEMRAVTTAADQLKNLKAIADQISGATARWNNAHEDAEKVAATAKGIAERMGAEVKSFTDFLQKANDGEKSTLRLETEKLRRAEAEWLQVVVRMLDHVYALHLGAVRSGQPNLIAQLTQFQNACRDAARRVGLAPFQPNGGETFDGERHQVLEGDGPPQPDSTVAETIATGYTFQGRQLRPALVRLSTKTAATPAAPNAPKSDPAQTRLAFEAGA